MPKGEMSATVRLDANSNAYQAIQAKVHSCWDHYGGDFSKWPAPKTITDEFKELLVKHAPNQNGKARELFKRLTNAKFVENG